eukprot:1460359-Amphidinium_carterae.1
MGSGAPSTKLSPPGKRSEKRLLLPHTGVKGSLMTTSNPPQTPKERVQNLGFRKERGVSGQPGFK